MHLRSILTLTYTEEKAVTKIKALKIIRYLNSQKYQKESKILLQSGGQALEFTGGNQGLTSTNHTQRMTSKI